jgi:hypothetical protein
MTKKNQILATEEDLLVDLTFYITHVTSMRPCRMGKTVPAFRMALKGRLNDGNPSEKHAKRR